MNLTYWRIEESRYACYDIHDDNGRFLHTYEVDLHHQQPAPYSWAIHIAAKTWSTPEMVAELAQIEQSYCRADQAAALQPQPVSCVAEIRRFD